jgi:hypothetical protein
VFWENPSEPLLSTALGENSGSGKMLKQALQSTSLF